MWLTRDANDFVNVLKAMQERNLCSQDNTWGPKPLLIHSSAFRRILFALTEYTLSLQSYLYTAFLRGLFALSAHSVYNHRYMLSQEAYLPKYPLSLQS